MSEQNLQIQPVSEITIPLDKVFKNCFNPSKTATERHIIEDKKSSVKTVVIFETFKGSLNQFDKIIFCAAVSEQRAGNKVFSIRRLWQKIGGGHTLTAEMKKLISDSVEKLICTYVTINMSAINNKLHYTDKEEDIFKNYLLPCKSVEKKINGQIVDGAYEFLDESPLFQVAELKKQFTEQPFELLDVPRLKNTELVLKLKFFLFERITAIIGSHKNHKAHIVGKKQSGGFIFKRATKLQKIITFKDIFKQCELSDAPNNRKAEYRKAIEKTLNHFKAEKWIREWHFEKKNGAYYSIHFS